ncbi:hypothetical protein CROQUDRAFT_46984 [Cronartium quercuum f. sp. fusiforme G11]|uniref:Peptidase A1 domain-containing protein n=1 Tax=Cronartium quercuum f. sp. fusiforme G11 TaxID=708437 RepID=A0A9P6NIG3_9BASI|nr:hypothetical protein CROQUDRAFT_46984 [Cronartium quercuum f. sp. fusiforme G11]
MFGRLLFSYLTISIVSSQFAIPLGPRSHNGVLNMAVKRSPTEAVVDWDSLKSAASRTQSRYTKKKIPNPNNFYHRRWIASTSLPQALRDLQAMSNHQSTNSYTQQTIPQGLGLVRVSSEPAENPASYSSLDLQKGTAFARLGLSRGTRYIHHQHGKGRFKKVQRPLNGTDRLQKNSAKTTGGHFTGLRNAVITGDQRRASLLSPSNSQSSNSHATQLIDSTSDKGDIEFYGQIQVGTPPKNYMIDFDTGSSDMWIKSSMCKKNCGKATANKHMYYNPESSSTSIAMNQTFKIAYGVGGVSGVMFKDSVSVSQFNVQNQAFASCDMLSEDWINDPADGVLGLAFEAIATSHAKPWFYNAISQNPTLAQAGSEMFSFAMGRFATGSYGQSELFIGGQNPQKYRGAFQWAPLISQTYWQIKLANLYCNNGTNSKFKVPIAPTTAIIDSGTTYIAAPGDQAKAFWDSVPNSSTNPGDGFYTFPCDQKIQMTFDFGNGLELLVSDLDMNLGKVSPESDRCVGAVFSGETGGDWILGISFMKSYYTTFDFGASRIGFALPSYH